MVGFAKDDFPVTAGWRPDANATRMSIKVQYDRRRIDNLTDTEGTVLHETGKACLEFNFRVSVVHTARCLAQHHNIPTSTSAPSPVSILVRADLISLLLSSLQSEEEDTFV